MTLKKKSLFSQPFFSGKLILHETRTTNGGHSSMTSSLFAANTAVMMPSPAEQVTDDLLSPKFENATTTDDDEDDDESDDTVYECPGLAGPGDMVVANPFFLQGSVDHLLSSAENGPAGGRAGAGGAGVMGGSGGVAEPKPISQSVV